MQYVYYLKIQFKVKKFANENSFCDGDPVTGTTTH